MPRRKEILYFDAPVFCDREQDRPTKSKEEYLALFAAPGAGDARYRVDGSVYNMYSQESLDRILQLSPHAKFILLLRDPLSASKSMHLQRLKYAETALRELSTDFCECWHLLEQRAEGKAFPEGCHNRMLFRYDLLYSYDRYLPHVYELIPPERLLIIDYAVYRSNRPKYTRPSSASSRSRPCRFRNMRSIPLSP